MRPPDRPGVVVLSLDFEMRWGMHHLLRADPASYRTSLLNAPRAAELLLRELECRGLRATWATVGAILCSGWDDYWSRAPAQPRYRDSRLQVAREIERIDPKGELHFCRDTVLRIASSAGQDIGCHTFSHALCARPGAEDADLDRELAACRSLWRQLLGREPASFVFPCNEVCAMGVLGSHGIRVVRVAPSYPRHLSLVRRCVDALRGVTCAVPGHVPHVGSDGIVRTVGSRFVRFGLRGPAWSLHIRALRSSVRAIAAGTTLHFWWHPHNLGHAPTQCIGRIGPLLDDIAEGIRRGRIISANMSDLAGGA